MGDSSAHDREWEGASSQADEPLLRSLRHLLATVDPTPAQVLDAARMSFGLRALSAPVRDISAPLRRVSAVRSDPAPGRHMGCERAAFEHGSNVRQDRHRRNPHKG
jgi:hypothetical protein